MNNSRVACFTARFLQPRSAKLLSQGVLAVPSHLTTPTAICEPNKQALLADPWTGELQISTEPASALLIPPGKSMPFLRVTLDAGAAIIGRSPEVELQLSDRFASRRHCALTSRNGKVFIRDLESMHGTYVNGQQLDSAELHDADILCIGTTRLVVTSLDSYLT